MPKFLVCQSSFLHPLPSQPRAVRAQGLHLPSCPGAGTHSLRREPEPVIKGSAGLSLVSLPGFKLTLGAACTALVLGPVRSPQKPPSRVGPCSPSAQTRGHRPVLELERMFEVEAALCPPGLSAGWPREEEWEGLRRAQAEGVRLSTFGWSVCSRFHQASQRSGASCPGIWDTGIGVRRDRQSWLHTTWQSDPPDQPGWKKGRLG